MIWILMKKKVREVKKDLKVKEEKTVKKGKKGKKVKKKKKKLLMINASIEESDYEVTSSFS